MGAKILFVDDSKLMKKAAQTALTSGGYEAVMAGDGVEGLAAVATEHQNLKLIFTDWNMPNMTGYEFLVELKKNAAYKHIPVVMVTSEGEKSEINKALAAGAADYVIKPFSSSDLLAKAKAIIPG